MSGASRIAWARNWIQSAPAVLRVVRQRRTGPFVPPTSGAFLLVFANPLGLLALLALPAVVGLHLFRRRFTPRPVSATFLWAPMDRAAHAGRKPAPLHRSPSFWLELLAVLLLALVLAGPRGCGGGDVVHAVIILDGSASMSANGHQEAASTAARRQIQRLPRSSRMGGAVILRGNFSNIFK